MNHSKKHYLIVGAGLSGISVAIQLIRKGAQVTLMDNGVNVSSSVAAGMINPLVFRRMTKSWRVDEFIPYLKSFYRQLEKETDSSFFHTVQIRRLFSTQQEHDFWLIKQEREDFKHYMNVLTEEDYSYSGGKNPFGSGRVKECCYVDVKPFFESMKQWVSSRGEILNEVFDSTLLENTTYRGDVYDDIIFCVGYLNPENKWFGALPLDQTKGETLTIVSNALPADVSLNRKCFVLPKGNHQFKIGSTYGWSDPTTHITQEGKNEILQNLSFIIDEKVTVIKQEAGVRPTTRDRRPLLGTHSEFKHYHIFNGLGAKGFMLAPLISLEFAEYLMDGVTLDKEVDIERYAEAADSIIR